MDPKGTTNTKSDSTNTIPDLSSLLHPVDPENPPPPEKQEETLLSSVPPPPVAQEPIPDISELLKEIPPEKVAEPQLPPQNDKPTEKTDDHLSSIIPPFATDALPKVNEQESSSIPSELTEKDAKKQEETTILPPPIVPESTREDISSLMQTLQETPAAPEPKPTPSQETSDQDFSSLMNQAPSEPTQGVSAPPLPPTKKKSRSPLKMIAALVIFLLLFAGGGIVYLYTTNPALIGEIRNRAAYNNNPTGSGYSCDCPIPHQGRSCLNGVCGACEYAHACGYVQPGDECASTQNCAERGYVVPPVTCDVSIHKCVGPTGRYFIGCGENGSLNNDSPTACQNCYKYPDGHTECVSETTSCGTKITCHGGGVSPTLPPGGVSPTSPPGGGGCKSDWCTSPADCILKGGTEGTPQSFASCSPGLVACCVNIQPTTPPNATATPNPTATPIVGQCTNIRVYKDSTVVEPSTLQPGDAVTLAVAGTNATKARFRVNGGDFTETTTKNSAGEYTLAFTVPSTGVTQFVIEAEVNVAGVWK